MFFFFLGIPQRISRRLFGNVYDRKCRRTSSEIDSSDGNLFSKCYINLQTECKIFIHWYAIRTNYLFRYSVFNFLSLPFPIDLGSVIEDTAEKQGFQIVPAFAGHGIGNYFHGAPDIFHFG